MAFFDRWPAGSERLPFFREVVGRSIARAEFSPVEERPLKWAVRIRSFGELVVVSAVTNAVHAFRSPSLLTDGNDDLLFTITRCGFSLAAQVGRECRLDTSTAVLLSNAEPGTNIYPASTDTLILRIPQRRLANLVPAPEDALMRPIPIESEPVSFLVDYVEMALGRDRLAYPISGRCLPPTSAIWWRSQSVRRATPPKKLAAAVSPRQS
jgi:hypothetical protein